MNKKSKEHIISAILFLTLITSCSKPLDYSKQTTNSFSLIDGDYSTNSEPYSIPSSINVHSLDLTESSEVYHHLFEGQGGWAIDSFHRGGYLIFENLAFGSCGRDNEIAILDTIGGSYYGCKRSFNVEIPTLKTFDNLVGLDLIDALAYTGLPSFLGSGSSLSLDFSLADGTVRRLFFEKGAGEWEYIVTSVETFQKSCFYLDCIIDGQKSEATVFGRLRALSRGVCVDDALRILGKANRRSQTDQTIFEWDISDGSTLIGKITKTKTGGCEHFSPTGQEDAYYELESFEIIKPS